MKPKVYFIRDITSENIIKIFDSLKLDLKFPTAVKVHTGEKGNQNFIKPDMLKPIIDHVGGTIVECNTAYDGQRNTTEKHLKLIEEHGWNNIGKIELLDESGEVELQIPNGKRIKKNYIGEHLQDFNSLLVISHFKGHPMGGYGGALKNISIGTASSYGKSYIHGAGNPDKMWETEQDYFLESMADASKSIMDLFKGRIAFINIMCNMSVDCDCCAEAEDPCMKDIGMLASLDPVALDQACIDLIYSSKDEGKSHLIERIESRNGLYTIECAEKLGVGSKEYTFIEDIY